MVWLAGQASVVTLAWLGCGRMAGVALLSEAKKHDINSFPGSWTLACFGDFSMLSYDFSMIC